MGRKLILTGTKLTDTTAPRLAVYDELEAPGSLFLADLTHPTGSWASGVPSEGATTPVPNIVAPLAQTVLGGSGTNLSGQFVRESAWSSTGSLFERTARGGLHAVTSPTMATNDTGAMLMMPDAIKTFVHANPAHAFYASVWGRVTKPPTNGTYQTWGEFAGWNNSPSNYLMIGLIGGTGYQQQGNAFPSTVGPGFGNMSSGSWTGVLPSTGSMFAHMMTLGHAGSWNFQANATAKKPGMIYYRAYLEDLTVSGRTYSQVSAIDQALYTREVLTAGGRYYGDTYTDPTTIA